MEPKSAIGRHARTLRESLKLTQEQVAAKTGISYQFLSGLENGRENFSVDVLDSLARALNTTLPRLIAEAYSGPVAEIPVVNPAYFRPGVPLPPGLTVKHIEAAMNSTQSLFGSINANLVSSGGKPLKEYIQANNFSGIVSNIFSDAMHQHSPYKHNSHQAYPDLINPKFKDGGLEVKTTIKIGKGGESHNGHSGWHLIACFQIDDSTGNIRFIHMMFAVLNGHTQSNPDWKYVGSKENAETGSRRTETYTTNSVGTTKLRDGTVFIDPNFVCFKRWKQDRLGPMPAYSIFNQSDQ